MFASGNDRAGDSKENATNYAKVLKAQLEKSKDKVDPVIEIPGHVLGFQSFPVLDDILFWGLGVGPSA